MPRTKDICKTFDWMEINGRTIIADVTIHYMEDEGDYDTAPYAEADYTVTRLIEVLEDGTEIPVPITDPDRHLMFDEIDKQVDAVSPDEYDEED